MKPKSIFYDLICPYGKKDTIENAEKIINEIETEDDYKSVLVRCIGYKSTIILEKVIKDPKLEELRVLLRNDDTGQRWETLRTRLLNKSLQSGDDVIFKLGCELFEVEDVIPEYEVLSDVVYRPDRYDDNFINTKTNVNYLTDIEKNLRHFEDVVTDMNNVYVSGHGLILQKEDAFKKLLARFGRELNDEEVEQVKAFAIEYYNFITNDFDEIIEDIKANKQKPDSKKDCWGLLYGYLGREPSDWETAKLWDHTCDTWACEEESEEEEEEDD